MYSSRGWSYSSSPTQATSAYRRRSWPRIRLFRFGPLPLAILIVGLLAWYHFLFPGFAVTGKIFDAATGQPIPAARLWSGHAATLATDDGSFLLEGVKPPEPISIDAVGYQSAALRPTLPANALVARLDPIPVDILVVDAETGEPVANAALSEPRLGRSISAGRLRVAPVRPNQRFQVTAPGYEPGELAYDGSSELRVELKPKLDGRITNAKTGAPVPGARVLVGGSKIEATTDGTFKLSSRPRDGQLFVLAPGYRRLSLEAAQRPSLELQLEPNPVRAIYMTYFAIGGDDYRREMFHILDTTEVNAVVIDLKGDYGLLSYPSRVPLAQQIGANDQPTINDLDGLLTSLHDHHAYAIARIVVFKDNVLARNGVRAGLDVSVKDRRTGQPWIDGEDLAWVDPFQPAAWDYNAALAREAIERGFDEVQFDYIRFATDPSRDSSVEDIVYSKPLTEDNRVSALKTFLSGAHAAVNAAGGFLSMDTFGYTTWWDNDGGIGQDLTVLADNIDYYSPMVYPSTFSAGLPGKIPYPNVVSRPYDVVYESLLHAQDKLAGKHVVVRPWLQYFDDYPWATKFRYDAPQIEAQKRAAMDAKSLGWMLWNAGSLFTRGGIAPK